MMNQVLVPCPWAQGEDYVHYHDIEWGVPCHERQRLFEKLCLEGQQAGLSWITVLRKREHYRVCFHQFVPEKVAAMSDAELNTLLQDTGLIRNKLKIFSIRKNAQALLKLEASGVDFAQWLWGFVNGQVQVHHYQQHQDIPAQTPASEAMSKALKKSGFSFIGPTICYAFMQSMGLVNDHLVTCPKHPMHL